MVQGCWIIIIVVKFTMSFPLIVHWAVKYTQVHKQQQQYVVVVVSFSNDQITDGKLLLLLLHGPYDASVLRCVRVYWLYALGVCVCVCVCRRCWQCAIRRGTVGARVCIDASVRMHRHAIRWLSFIFHLLFSLIARRRTAQHVRAAPYGRNMLREIILF